MNDQLAERIATALEQLVLELQSRPSEPVAAALAAPLPAQAAPQGPYPPIGWRCPVHGSSKVVPAGVSQRTGRPYTSFVACDQIGCNEKPPRADQPIPQRAIPPSQLP